MARASEFPARIMCPCTNEMLDGIKQLATKNESGQDRPRDTARLHA